MAKFFMLDVETTGIDPKTNDIVTIQFQELDCNGKPVNDLLILRNWESSEENIVKIFHQLFVNNFVWDFIPVGTNLLFDFTFLLEKFRKYNLPINKDSLEFIFSKPYIDIRHLLIIANGMQFKGSGLDSMTTKESDGRLIPEYFKEKKYDLIEKYVRMETEAFIKAFQIIIVHQKDLKAKLKNGN